MRSRMSAKIGLWVEAVFACAVSIDRHGAERVFLPTGVRPRQTAQFFLPIPIVAGPRSAGLIVRWPATGLPGTS